MATSAPGRDQAAGAGGTPPDDPTAAAAPSRACARCGAGLADGQDWCLECGTAAPGRLGRRPGMRAAVAVATLTLLLVGGAVAASYAALSTDANRRAGTTTPADASPVAQAPPVIPDTPAPAPAPKLPKGTSTTTLPGAGAGAGATPPAPIGPLPSAPAPSAGSPDLVSPPSGTTTTPSTTTTTPSTTTTTPAPAPLVALKIPDGGAALYDPYTRATAQGDPARAIDGKPATSFFVTTADDGQDQQVGLLVDLGAVKRVRAVELATSTPGGTIEVYGADGSAVPTDILDTRWTHLAARKDVDGDRKAGNEPGDGKEQIKVATPGAASADSGARVRRVLLWFTVPPSAGHTVRISELKLLG
jgi:hypothetical protein